MCKQTHHKLKYFSQLLVALVSVNSDSFLLHRRPRSLFVFFVSSSLIADGANQRATTLPIPRVVSRDLPVSPRFTPTSFYRDAGSALLHLVNQW